MAGQLASAAGARLRLRAVIDDRLPYVGWAPPGGPDVQEIWDELIEPDVESLREAAERAASASGADVEVETKPGSPPEELIALSEDVDLLVIGSRRWGAAARVLLGTTGEELMHDARARSWSFPARPGYRRGAPMLGRHQRLRDSAGRDAAPRRTRLPRNVLVLSWVSFFADASSEMLYPVFPIFVTQTRGASAAALGLIEGVAEATASIGMAISGRLADRWRRRPMIATGYGISAIAKPIVGLARAWPLALVGPFVDRAGKGLRDSPRDALVPADTSKKSRGTSGYQRALDRAGAVVGPLLGIGLYESDLCPPDLVGTGLGLYQGAIGVCVLIAGIWAGQAWNGNGRFPLIFSGGVVGVLAIGLLTIGRSLDPPHAGTAPDPA